MESGRSEDRRRELILDVAWALALLALAVLLRHVFAGDRAIVIDHDSTSYVQRAREILRGGPLFHLLHGPGYPLWIALWTFVAEDPFRAARLASIASGSLLAPAVFLAGRHLYGRWTGVLAGALVAINVALIEISTWELTEPTYALALFVASGAAIWAAGRGGAPRWALAGSAFGFCYWIRPEAAVYLLLIPAVALGSRWLARRRSIRSFGPTRPASLAAFAAAGALFVAPVVIHIQAETGAWTINGRTHIGALIHGRPAEGFLAQERAMYRITDDGEAIARERFSEGRMVATFAQNLPFKARTALRNLERTNRLLPTVFPALLLLFAGIGLWSLPWRLERRWPELYLAAVLLPWAFVYPLYEIQYENLAPVAPFFSLWAALGIVEVGSRAGVALGGDRWRGPASVLVVGGVLLVLLALELRPFVFHVRNPEGYVVQREDHPVHHEVADWIRENLPSDVRIMTRKLFVPRYADRRWVPFPFADYEDVLAFARRRGADVLLLEERQRALRPAFDFVFEEGAEAAGLRALYAHREVPGRSILLFRVLPDEGTEAPQPPAIGADGL